MKTSVCSRYFWSLVSILIVGLTTFTNSAAQGVAFPGNFPFKLGYDKSVPPARGPIPAVNAPFVDPVHGTTITRITEEANNWRRHEYSRRPAFNANSTRIIMRSSGGFWHLYRLSGRTVGYDHALPVMTEPNWHPTDPRRFYYFIGDADDQKIREYNIVSQTSRVVVDFAGRLPWRGVHHVWTRWEGRPSRNGRIWCLMAEDRNDKALGMFSYDIESDRIIGTQRLTVDPDHVSTSVNGRYCLPSAASPYGVRAYNLTFSRYTQLTTKSEHSDTVLDSAGRDVLVVADFTDGYVSMIDMASARTTRLIPIYSPPGSKFSVHFSGLATDVPGYVVMSTYATKLNRGSVDANYGDMWGHDRLAVVELKANPTIYNIAYMRNGRAGYWSEPQATVNRDLTKIIYASTWGSNNDRDSRSYMVHLDNAKPTDKSLVSTITRKIRHTTNYLTRTPNRHFNRQVERAILGRRLRALQRAVDDGNHALSKKHAKLFIRRIDGCGRRPQRDDYVTSCWSQQRLFRNFKPAIVAVYQRARLERTR